MPNLPSYIISFGVTKKKFCFPPTHSKIDFLPIRHNARIYLVDKYWDDIHIFYISSITLAKSQEIFQL